MLSLDSLKALSECTVSDGIIKLGKPLKDEAEYFEFRNALRTAFIDGLVPVYKPVAVKVCGAKFQRVTNIDKEMDESYLGMIQQLSEAIIMPETEVETYAGEWLDIDEMANRMFNTSRVIASNKIPSKFLLYAKTFDAGPQTIDCFKYMKDKTTYGKNISVETLKPLLMDSRPIVTISDNDMKLITLELVFALGVGDITYLDVEKTIGATKTPYMPVTQYYGMERYFTIRCFDEDLKLDELEVGFKRDVDESVLQAILRNFANMLLSYENKEFNTEQQPLFSFLNGKVNEMWEGSSKCW